MKTTYSYEVAWWTKDKEKPDKYHFGGYATGIANCDSKDILGCAFRQHQEMLPADRVKVSYYEL